MKRLLPVFVLLLAVPAALAQPQGDVLLTDDGTLYTAAVEWSHEHPEVGAKSNTFVSVTVRQPDSESRRLIVPATLSMGANANPALAFDQQSGTLFVFWQYAVNAMASELRFISLDRNGNWSAPSSFANAAYQMRRNLRIALTSKAGEYDENRNLKWVPELNVHATWWEQTAFGEIARYAMLSIHDGEVEIHVHDLKDFLKVEPTRRELPADYNLDLFRHPAVFETPEGDKVDIVFGSLETNSLHRVSISPIADARVRIPVGVHDRTYDPPNELRTLSEGRIDTISPNPDRLVFYFQNRDVMSYVVYRDGAWSSLRSLALTEDLTRGTAVGAIRRLVGAQ